MVGAAWMAAHTSGFAAGWPVFAAALLSAAVNLTAEPSSEPPRGGEHGAGVTCLNKKPSIRGIPKLSKIIACVSRERCQRKRRWLWAKQVAQERIVSSRI